MIHHITKKAHPVTFWLIQALLQPPVAGLFLFMQIKKGTMNECFGQSTNFSKLFFR